MGEPDSVRCARTLVAELVAQGVLEVVLSPGSRSAPLAFALHAADQARQLRLHVRVDERTAAFLALGLIQGSGAPVAVATTSGSAVAHLHPAVLEAWHAHLPLVVVSADRPRSLVHTGANQTTEQQGLLVPHLRASASVSDTPADAQTWRFETARLVVAATGVRSRSPGPVHLNVELSDPLVPTGPLPPMDEGASVGVQPVGGLSSPTPLVTGPASVVLAGHLPPGPGRALAAQCATAGWPLLAEPSSNARAGVTAVATYRLLLAGSLADAVERVVVVGHPTLSRPGQRLLARRDVELIVVSPYADWPDPGRAAALVTDAVDLPAADPVWLAAWRDADRARSDQLARLLARQTGPTGPALAAAVWAALGPDDLLVAGASNPIRDLDLAPPSTAGAPAVFANRGLSGIDGTISTAAGIALAHGRPVTALLGDVTAVHDLTGLVIGPQEPRPDLRIVIANDDGGSIFATLEPGAPEHAEAYERLFGTPHRVDFGALASAVGARHRRVNDLDPLAALLRAPIRGIELVEVIVDRVDRRGLAAAIGDGI